MAKIRHVAFMIKDTAKTRDFYQQAFGFEECYSSASGAFMVMDGTFNIAILPILDKDSDVVGTHLHNGNFNILANREYGERNANMIVEIAARGMHIEPCC